MLYALVAVYRRGERGKAAYLAAGGRGVRAHDARRHPDRLRRHLELLPDRALLRRHRARDERRSAPGVAARRSGASPLPHRAGIAGRGARRGARPGERAARRRGPGPRSRPRSRCAGAWPSSTPCSTCRRRWRRARTCPRRWTRPRERDRRALPARFTTVHLARTPSGSSWVAGRGRRLGRLRARRPSAASRRSGRRSTGDRRSSSPIPFTPSCPPTWSSGERGACARPAGRPDGGEGGGRGGAQRRARSRAPAFGESEAKVAQTVADALAAAVENERLHQRETRQAAADERQHLARELHDAVTQTHLLGDAHRRGACRRCGSGSPTRGCATSRRSGGWCTARWPRCARCSSSCGRGRCRAAPLDTLLERLGVALSGQIQIPVEVSVRGGGRRCRPT